MSPRVGFAWSPFGVAADGRPRQRRALLRPRAAARARQRAAVGGQHHRPGATCGRSASACRRRRPARRCFPNILAAAGAVGHAAEPDDDGSATCRTRTRGRRASRSSSSSATRSTVSVGYQYTARAAPDHVGQPERAVVRRGRHQQRLPAEPDLRQQQPVLVGRRRRTITGCTCRSCSGRRGGATTASATRYSKSMNNVGESFFSSPIDPFDLSKDWGRSDDDQRHRLVVNGASNADGPARRVGALTHGFQVSGMLQAYSALPFNITSGVTTIQGTAGRPIVERRVHRAQRRRRQRLLQPEPARRAARSRWADACGSKGWSRRSTSPTARNAVTRNGELRRRRVSDEPVADLRTDHGGRRTEEPCNSGCASASDAAWSR